MLKSIDVHATLWRVRRFARLLPLAVLLAVAACGGSSPEAGAERAARQWLDALNAGNIAAAQAVSAEQTRAMLQMAAAMGESGGMGPGRYSITDVTASGDNAARVTVLDEDGDYVVLDMVRVNGQWLVAAGK
jgi:hypothetical protein